MLFLSLETRKKPWRNLTIFLIIAKITSKKWSPNPIIKTKSKRSLVNVLMFWTLFLNIWTSLFFSLFYNKNLLSRYNTNDSKTPKNLSKIEHMNVILDKVLEIAEFIIRDPKYKKHIENSSKILNDFLNLIEKVENKLYFYFFINLVFH